MIKLISPNEINTTLPVPLHIQYERMKETKVWDERRQWMEEWAEKEYAPAIYLLANDYKDNVKFSPEPAHLCIQDFKYEKDKDLPFDVDCLIPSTSRAEDPGFSIYRRGELNHINCFILGICYYKGRSGYSKNYSKALDNFKKAAKWNDCQDAYGNNLLGICYYHGHGVL